MEFKKAGLFKVFLSRGITPKKWRLLEGRYNSTCAKITDTGGRTFLVKGYPVLMADKRQRLVTEFQGLQFLWRHGFRQIPEPIFSDPERNVAVYEYIEATPIGSPHMDKGIGRQILSFIAGLKRLSVHESACGIGQASEACFCLDDYWSNLIFRKRRLEKYGVGLPSDFFRDRLNPLFRKLEGNCQRRDAKAVLPRKFRTLSQSDVGFHNCLCRKNGRLVFVDFEYFGWDDPAKMLSDFILQPDHPIPAGEVDWFKRRYFEIYADDSGLPKRFQAVYLILWMKWCLIMLNCFLPDRQFHAGQASRSFRQRQLQKADRYLKQLSLALDGYPWQR